MWTLLGPHQTLKTNSLHCKTRRNVMSQQPASFDYKITSPTRLQYLQYLPEDYEKDSAKKWPLILFLHGAGERGDDLDLVKKHGIARVVEERPLPFITLSPQCPANHWWSDFLPAIDALVAEAVETLNADPQRIYLTGLSMGAFGSWHLAAEYPHRFAAIAPICGGYLWMYGFPERVSEIKDIPTWVFHGAKDPVVPIEASQAMVDQLKACGSDVRFTIYPEADHDSWTETYNNPAFYEWLLSYQKTG